jgi:hypothetical protein
MPWVDHGAYWIGGTHRDVDTSNVHSSHKPTHDPRRFTRVGIPNMNPGTQKTNGLPSLSPFKIEMYRNLGLYSFLDKSIHPHLIVVVP